MQQALLPHHAGPLPERQLHDSWSAGELPAEEEIAAMSYEQLLRLTDKLKLVKCVLEIETI